jgi:diacylglycerol kinase family enzyme
MRVTVVVNSKGGTVAGSAASPEDMVAQAFADAGIDADIRVPAADQLATCLDEAAQDATTDAMVVGGGDGTVSLAASAAVRHGKTLGVLPLGTLNHLARDAGIPPDLPGAVAVIAGGHVETVDVAEVNGELFVNNSSVGLYPLMVREREAQQRNLGRSKRFAMLVASVRALRHFGRRRLTIRIAGREHPITTPLLFVGNNCYDISLFSLGRRARLDGGTLCLYALLARSRWQLIGMALRGLVGRLDQQSDFISVNDISEAEIASERPALTVALDGEVRSLETPLHYKIKPRVLSLLMPAPQAKESAVAGS